MTFNFSKLFKLAHQIAKANRANFATYREAAEKYTAQLRSEARRDTWRRPACSFAGNISA